MSLTSGGDTRTPITAFTTFPLNAVVGVDATYGANAFPIPSSGITIAPNHVLTAGHSAFQNGAISNPTGTTVSANLTTRTAAPNVTARYFPT
jgi:V8-like Glu-specific endopeptidase